MTQNEKLRVLLKEARDWMVDDTCRDCERDGREMRQRIEAALAEPVEGGGCLRCYALGELRVIDQRKNDEAQAEIRNVYAELREARAEIERLRALLDGVVMVLLERVSIPTTESHIVAFSLSR